MMLALLIVGLIGVALVIVVGSALLTMGKFFIENWWLFATPVLAVLILGPEFGRLSYVRTRTNVMEKRR